jgi:hypothetical protein
MASNVESIPETSKPSENYLPIIPLENKNIRINPEESKDQFGDELFEQLIINFVEKDYEDKKTQIEDAMNTKDSANLYYIVHTFKTTARMLCIEDFAKECEVIQEYSFKGREDWDKLKIYVPQFLSDFKRVFEDAKEIYDKDYKPKPAEILDDCVSEIKEIPSKHKNSENYFNDAKNNLLNNQPTDEEITEEEIFERLKNGTYTSEVNDKVYDLLESIIIIIFSS